jgi:hypothetical protein
MKLLRIQEALDMLFRKEGNVKILGVASLEDEINVYYANNGETKIYTEGKK